ncbi:hypothetical protein GGS21DRAFT_499903 [Xylaria nigripes]|nr:hypothetical protein GGS21DRAFT_499903 [Xylaria nigripes]
MSTISSSAKKQPITLAQLSSYDDIITDVLIDHAYYWTTIPKNRPSYRPSRGVTEEEITNIIQSHLIVDPNLEVAESKLLAIGALRRFYNALKTPKEQCDFRAHLQRYMRIHLPDCPFEVHSTNRYTIYNHEAAITARKYIKRGQPIKYLSGIQVMITATEDNELAKRKKDFSIVISSRNKCAALFMGPARFANHDCNANARLVINGQAGIEIVATRNIYVGDEITISYAANYFGVDNCECLCKTCEDKAVNGWAPEGGSAEVLESIENFPEGYSLRRRRKRRDDSCASGSRTSSLTPDIRPRIRKLRPKTQNSGPERESLCDSPAPQDILRQKRKREYDSLQSPPITPAKKVKTIQYELESIPLPSESQMRNSDDTASSEHSTSSFTNSDVVMTDVTTPEEEPHDKTLQSPVLTPVRPLIPALGEEDSDSSALTDFSRTPSMPPTFNTEMTGIESNPTGSSTESLTRLDERSNNNVPNADDSTSITVNCQNNDILSLDLVALSAKTTDILEETSPISMTSPGNVLDVLVQEHNRGRLHSRDERKRGGGSNTAQLADDAILVTKKRAPGDYTLTPALLSEPNMAWIHCTNCGDAFVQENAYYTRSSCFRCERHSKLYGYPWPKTEKEGPNDKDERVLDHRTIHRFLAPKDEARIRGRNPTLPPARVKPPSVARASEPSTLEESIAPKRGPGRPRKHPAPQKNETHVQSNDEGTTDLQRDPPAPQKTETCIQPNDGSTADVQPETPAPQHNEACIQSDDGSTADMQRKHSVPQQIETCVQSSDEIMADLQRPKRQKKPTLKAAAMG